MNTSGEAIKRLQEALKTTDESKSIIQNLIVAHDYQDVAQLVAQAAAELLGATALLMQLDGDGAFNKIEEAEDLLDAVYKIMDGELDDE